MQANQNNHKIEPFFAAVETGDLRSVKNYLDRIPGAARVRDSVLGETPLHAATCFGHVQVAKLLIDHGADVKAGDDQMGMTPLHWAASCGHVELADLLVRCGADAQARDKRGLTPIDVALERHHASVAEVLKKHNGGSGRNTH